MDSRQERLAIEMWKLGDDLLSHDAEGYKEGIEEMEPYPVKPYAKRERYHKGHGSYIHQAAKKAKRDAARYAKGAKPKLTKKTVMEEARRKKIASLHSKS